MWRQEPQSLCEFARAIHRVWQTESRPSVLTQLRAARSQIERYLSRLRADEMTQCAALFLRVKTKKSPWNSSLFKKSYVSAIRWITAFKQPRAKLTFFSIKSLWVQERQREQASSARPMSHHWLFGEVERTALGVQTLRQGSSPSSDDQCIQPGLERQTNVPVITVSSLGHRHLTHKLTGPVELCQYCLIHSVSTFIWLLNSDSWLRKPIRYVLLCCRIHCLHTRPFHKNKIMDLGLEYFILVEASETSCRPSWDTKPPTKSLNYTAQ